jgi:sulfite exporter TauE/SafE
LFQIKLPDPQVKQSVDGRAGRLVERLFTHHPRMEVTLVLSAFLLGLAGIPHCAAMCGPVCAAVVGGRRSRAIAASFGISGSAYAFHLARAFSYSVAGGVAAAGVAWMASASMAAPLLRPMWTLLHIAAMTLGLWMLWTGRQPQWMSQLARQAPADGSSAGWQSIRGPRSAAVAGALWVAWPCGLLHSALVVAGLANTALGGALVMASFAIASAGGLQVAPWVWSRWLSSRGGTNALSAASRARTLVRAAGGLLVVGSAWALGMDVWGRVWDYCFG